MRAELFIKQCQRLLGDPAGDFHDMEKTLEHLNTALDDISTRSRTLCTWNYQPVINGQGMYGLPEEHLEFKYVGFYYQGELCELVPGSVADAAPAIFSDSQHANNVPYLYAHAGNARIEKVVSVTPLPPGIRREIARTYNRYITLARRPHEYTLAESVYTQYAELTARQDLEPELPENYDALFIEVFKKLEDPDVHQYLNLEIINYVVENATIVQSLLPDLDEGFVTFLRTNNQILAFFRVPEVQELLLDRARIRELIGIIEAPPNPQLAETVYARYRNLLNGEFIQALLPPDRREALENVARVLTDPRIQEVLTPENIDLALLDPDILSTFVSNINPLFIEMLKNNTELQFIFRDKDVRDLLASTQTLQAFIDLWLQDTAARENAIKVDGNRVYISFGTDDAETEYLREYDHTQDNEIVLTQGGSSVRLPIANSEIKTPTLELTIDQDADINIFDFVDGEPVNIIFTVPNASIDKSGEVNFWIPNPTPDIKIGDKLINFTDGSEGLVSDVDNSYRRITFLGLTGGVRNTVAPGDEIRILSATLHTHAIAISPPPSKTDDIGNESLYVYQAQSHKVFTPQDLENENDQIELDADFNSTLRNRVMYYASLEEKGISDRNTIGFDVQYETDYAKAFPKANRKIRQYLSSWRVNRRRLPPRRTIAHAGDWSEKRPFR